MLQMQLQRNLGRQCLHLTGGESRDYRIDYREQMLLHNHVEGIPDLRIVQSDNEKVYEYDIAEKESADILFGRIRPGRERIVGLLRDILQTVFRGREFMLSEDDFVISPDTVFVDRNYRTSILYYSGYGQSLRLQLKGFAEYLMNKVDPSDESAVLLVYAFYMKTNDESCSTEDLINLIEGRDEKAAGRLPEHQIEYRDEQTDEFSCPGEAEEKEPRIDETELIRLMPRDVKIKIAVSGVAAVLAGTAVILFGRLAGTFAEGGMPVKVIVGILISTGVFSVSGIPFYLLYRRKAVSRINRNASEQEAPTELLTPDGSEVRTFSLVSDELPAINASRFPFYIGKDPTRVDYVIRESGISRYHAELICEAGVFYIMDLNSLNGTYINEKRCQPHVPYAVSRGDRIRLGRCVYYCN